LSNLSLRIFTSLILCLTLVHLSAQKKDMHITCPAPVIIAMMNKYHVSPRHMDEQFISDVLNDFIQELDPDHLIFMQADIREIRAKKGLVALELQGKNNDFLNETAALYQSRLQKADSLIHLILQKPLNLSAKEYIALANDSSDFPASEQECKTRWTKWLKYEELDQLSDLATTDQTTPGRAFIEEHEWSVRDKELKKMDRKINRILDPPGSTYGAGISEYFCSVVATAYDPHSEYLPQGEKEDFVGQVTGESYMLGISLGKNDKGEVVISHLAPGTPAWKNGELNKNDVLVSLKWEGEKLVDLTGATIDEANDWLSTSNRGPLKLTVRKEDGMKKTVVLRKEKMRDDEDFVKSFILNGSKRIGYILLPGFYTEWEINSGSSCANDVAKEVIKLKKENIDGLILDLRNNGGGSMEESMQLAGIFIDEGTVGIARDNTGKSSNLKDPNRGTIYDGPMMVMVNGYSASASELVAGALQDYNRAIIVGSPTFGKATIQQVLALDTSLDLNKMNQTEMDRIKGDFVKITVGKLYRATGRSNQFNGVQPDVLLPDLTEVYGERELSMKYALPADTVKRAVYFHPLVPIAAKSLAENSWVRVSADSGFQCVRQAKTLLKRLIDEGSRALPLQCDSFFGVKTMYRQQVEQIEKCVGQDSTSLFMVANHADDRLLISADPVSAEVNENSFKNISKDIYIHESFRILVDYIRLLHKN